MAKKHRNRRPPNRGATRRHTSGPSATQPASPGPAPDPADDPLLGPLRAALRNPDPTSFWVAASPIVTILEDPGDLVDQLPEGVDLLQSFIEVDVTETTALLHMVDALSRDDMLRARARRALNDRRQPVPPHVSGLREAEAGQARMFGDLSGDNIMVELSLPREVRATLVVLVTRRPHLYLKDAFVVGERLERMEDRYGLIMKRQGFEPAHHVQTVEPAQARAALEQALAGIRPDVAKQPEEGDQWPMVRPFVEHVISLLPEGGAGYDEDGLLVGLDRTKLVGEPPRRRKLWPW